MIARERTKTEGKESISPNHLSGFHPHRHQDQTKNCKSWETRIRRTIMSFESKNPTNIR